MTWQMVYWITRLDMIRVLMIVCTVFGGGGTLSYIVFWIASKVECEEEARKDRKIYKALRPTIYFFFISLMGLTFIPSTKEACAIYLIPKVVNNEEVQKVPNNALKLLNAKLEEWIDEQIGDEDAPQD